MTVKELREQLSQFDDDLLVCAWNYNDGYGGHLPIESVKQIAADTFGSHYLEAEDGTTRVVVFE